MSGQISGYRGNLIRLVTFLAGLYFFVEFILPKSAIEAIGLESRNEAITNGFIVVGTMAFGLGLISLISVHGGKVAFVRKGWINSVALLVGLVASMVVTVVAWRQNLAISRETLKISSLADFAEKFPKNEVFGTPSTTDFRGRVALLVGAAKQQLQLVESHGQPAVPEEKQYSDLLAAALQVANQKTADLDFQVVQGADEKALTTTLLSFAPAIREVGSADSKLLRVRQSNNLAARLYRLLFDGIFVSLGSAMFSLLGLYIAAAAYRAFRIRSVESSLMMAAAVLVMLGQISFGEQIYEGMPAIRQWLLEVPNSAAFRAIRIGAALAALLLGIRMWLSIESDDFSKSESRR